MIKGILHRALSSEADLELAYRRPAASEASMLQPDETTQLRDRNHETQFMDEFARLVQVI